jgi:4-azaleucine resistance transporter AzlC
MKSLLPFDREGLLAGIRQSVAIGLGVFTYGLLFGALARQAGLSLAESLTMSSLVLAGASQLIVLDLWHYPLPIATIILTTLVVNLRHLLMGAVLSPWFSRLTRLQAYGSIFFLSDESWALTLSVLTKGTASSSFLLGSGLAILVSWVGATFLGYTVGSLLGDPAVWGLDFAFTAIFIALLVGLWRGKSDWLPWVVAAIAAIAADTWLPGNGYILIGTLAGSIVGVWCHDDRS